jgi:hypothetical protein
MATGKWVRVGRIPGDRPFPELEVTGLTPGAEYKFRVSAVNDEGDSEPLVTERATIAKNPYGKLFLNYLYSCIFYFWYVKFSISLTIPFKHPGGLDTVSKYLCSLNRFTL